MLVEIFSFFIILPIKIGLENKPINTYTKNKLIFKVIFKKESKILQKTLPANMIEFILFYPIFWI
jgi:hypothetical protein